MMPSFIGKIKTRLHRCTSKAVTFLQTPKPWVRLLGKVFEGYNYSIVCLETLERRVLHWQEQRACGAFWVLQQSCMNRSVMGAPGHWKAWSLAVGRELWRVLLVISVDVDCERRAAGSGRETANNVVFHHRSMPSDLSCVGCWLSPVTFWLEQNV